MGDETARKGYSLVISAVLAGIIMLMTMFIRIPVPATRGYIHLGDCMIFVAIIILGTKGALIAGIVGSTLADFLGGYAFYVPATFFAKGLMILVAGLFIAWASKRPEKNNRIMPIIGMVLGGLTMTAVYYLFEVLMFGSFVTPLISIPLNCLQFAAGIALAIPLSLALEKTPIGRDFKNCI